MRFTYILALVFLYSVALSNPVSADHGKPPQIGDEISLNMWCDEEADLQPAMESATSDAEYFAFMKKTKNSCLDIRVLKAQGVYLLQRRAIVTRIIETTFFRQFFIEFIEALSFDGRILYTWHARRATEA